MVGSVTRFSLMPYAERNDGGPCRMLLTDTLRNDPSVSFRYELGLSLRARKVSPCPFPPSIDTVQPR